MFIKNGKLFLAIDHLNKMIELHADDNLKSIYVKKYIFHLLLCYLAQNDIVACSNALKTFESEYNFFQIIESTLVIGLIESISNHDVVLFENSCRNFDKIKPLGPLEVDLLSLAKEFITTNENNNNNTDDIDLS